MISALAVIDTAARIDPTATIEAGAHVHACAIIGRNVRVESGAVIGYGAPEEGAKPTVLEDGVLVATHSVIYHGVVLEAGAKVRHHVVVREHVTIGRETSIGSLSTIEHHSSIGACCSLHSRVHLTDYSTVSDYVFIGPGFVSMSDTALNYRRPALEETYQGVTIARGARIGGGVLAMPGAVIGEEAVIGAGGLVRGKLDGGYVYLGNPLRAVRKVSDRERLP